MITKISIKRFRSIWEAELTPGNPTFLVGRNGSGKSNIVDAISFLSSCVQKPLQACFDERGGYASVAHRTSGKGRPMNLSLSVHFQTDRDEGHYEFEVCAGRNQSCKVVHEECTVDPLSTDNEKRISKTWFRRSGNKFDGKIFVYGNDLSEILVSQKTILEDNALALFTFTGLPPFSALINQLKGIRSYAIDPAKIAEHQDPDLGIVLKRNGSNTASVINHLRKSKKMHFDRLCEFLNTIIPGTVSVNSEKYGNKIALKFMQECKSSTPLVFDSYEMSDGTRRALGLLAAVFQDAPISLLILEEPEITIHPGALGVILDLIKSASSQYQVLLTTHSPEVLDADWIKPEHLRLVSWQNGMTTIENAPPHAVSMMQDHLMGAGELLRSNAFEQERLWDSADCVGK